MDDRGAGGGKKDHPLGFKKHPLEDTCIRTQCMSIYIDRRHVYHPNENRIHHYKFPANLPSMKFTLMLQKLHQR